MEGVKLLYNVSGMDHSHETIADFHLRQLAKLLEEEMMEKQKVVQVEDVRRRIDEKIGKAFEPA